MARASWFPYAAKSLTLISHVSKGQRNKIANDYFVTTNDLWFIQMVMFAGEQWDLYGGNVVVKNKELKSEKEGYYVLMKDYVFVSVEWRTVWSEQ